MGAKIRKTTAFFLLVLVLVPMCYIFIFQARQQSIQHRMKERLEEQLLHSIVLEKDQIHWFKPGKEIVINDQFFDVKKTEQLANGKVRLTGLYDEEETRLVRQMKETLDQERSRQTRNLITFFFQLQAIPGETPGTDPPSAMLSIRYPGFNDSDPASPFRGIITPPPQA